MGGLQLISGEGPGSHFPLEKIHPCKMTLEQQELGVPFKAWFVLGPYDGLFKGSFGLGPYEGLF